MFFFEKGVQLGPGGKEAVDTVDIRFKGRKGDQEKRRGSRENKSIRGGWGGGLKGT